MKTTSLACFLSFLSSQTRASLQGDAVDRFFRWHRVDHEELHPFIYFREDTYGRNLVFRSDHCELLVLTWLPGQRTPIHDHGGQRCWMLMHTGALTFKTYAPLEDDRELPPQLGETTIHQVGEAVYLDDGIGIHSIANASTKPAVSLHLYAGPIPRCRIYDEKARRFAWVELRYFTEFGQQARSPAPALP